MLTPAQLELLRVIDGCGAATASVTAVKVLIDLGYVVITGTILKLTPAGAKELQCSKKS